jgi:hypothetical protein
MKNMGNYAKPKLLFFQYKYDEDLPAFLLSHKREHVKCLQEFFAVRVINEDCDYRQICETYQPEITLFEVGLNHLTCRRPKIRNVRGYSDIPRIALHNIDAWCETRAGIVSDMEHLGIETSFSISTTAAEHTPGISENLFTWANCIDPEIYRDYGESKIIPVLLTGARFALYPWRQKMFKLISEYYPSLSCPHGGYGRGAAEVQLAHGVKYARMINASNFVPTCGTVAKEVVRKHFEIPACKSCLITERSPGLEAAGFVDMRNCVFADERDVLDKLSHLFKNPDELEAVTNAGYELVRSRHTLKHRDQILQWFTLNRKLQANEKIVQLGCFGPLAVVKRSSGTWNCHVNGNGVHLALLCRADERLWSGRYKEAEALYLSCLNYMRAMPEPKLRMALVNLYRGNPQAALRWIVAPLEHTLVEYKAVDPDPVEWAYYIVTLLCLGKVKEARVRAKEFVWVRHLELDRIRRVLDSLNSKGIGVRALDSDQACRRTSIHQMPERCIAKWLEELVAMLTACRQQELAEAVVKFCLSSPNVIENAVRWSATSKSRVVAGGGRKGNGRRAPGWVPRRDSIGMFRQRLIYTGIVSKAREWVARMLHNLERRLGHFLPYRWSERKSDEFFAAIQKVTEEKDMKAVLLIGAASGEGSTEAALAGVMRNRNRPLVYCVNGATMRFCRLEKSFIDHPSVRCHRVLSDSREHFAEQLERVVKSIKEENQISSFDVVLLDSSAMSDVLEVDSWLSEEMLGARLLLLDDINLASSYEIRDRLLRDCDYVLIAENARLRNGYAIFERCRKKFAEGKGCEMERPGSDFETNKERAPLGAFAKL